MRLDGRAGVRRVLEVVVDPHEAPPGGVGGTAIDPGILGLTFERAHHAQEVDGHIRLLGLARSHKAPAAFAHEMWGVGRGYPRRAREFVGVAMLVALDHRRAVASGQCHLARQRRIHMVLVQFGFNAHLHRRGHEQLHGLHAGIGVDVEVLVVVVPPVGAFRSQQTADDAEIALGVPALAAEPPTDDRAVLFLLQGLGQFPHGGVGVEIGFAVGGRECIGHAHGLNFVHGHVDHAADAVHFGGHAPDVVAPRVGLHRIAIEVLVDIKAVVVVDRLPQRHQRVLDVERHQHLAHDAGRFGLGARGQRGDELGFDGPWLRGHGQFHTGLFHVEVRQALVGANVVVVLQTPQHARRGHGGSTVGGGSDDGTGCQG